MAFVQQYNQKVTQALGDKKVGKSLYKIFFGTELEYEVVTPKSYDKNQSLQLREEVGKKIHPLIKSFAFIKHDGSLKNGFEVVSLPMSLETHRKSWDEFFSTAAKNGLEVKNSCGMHVHVSRELLTPFQIGKMLVFIFSPNNASFIKMIAGRKPPEKYAEMKPKCLKDVRRHKERYSALNLRNPETIEFRMFKGTLVRENVLKNIEFCDAVVRFTWPSKFGYQELCKNGVKLFCSFISENKSEYPNLYKFLLAHKNITNKNKKGRQNKKTQKKTSSLVDFLQNESNNDDYFWIDTEASFIDDEN